MNSKGREYNESGLKIPPYLESEMEVKLGKNLKKKMKAMTKTSDTDSMIQARKERISQGESSQINWNHLRFRSAIYNLLSPPV